MGQVVDTQSLSPNLGKGEVVSSILTGSTIAHGVELIALLAISLWNFGACDGKHTLDKLRETHQIDG